MAACARAFPFAPPRLVLDASASPHVRLRLWESDGADVTPPSHVAHNTVELAWPTEGAIGYAIGSRHFEVGVGNAMLVPSDVEHATSFMTALHATALRIDRDTVHEIGDAMGWKAGPAIGLVRDGARLASLGAVLTEESARGARGDRGALLAADAIAEAMIAMALRGAPEEMEVPHVPRDPAIASVVRYIESSYAEPLTVDGMAKAAKMSRFHFSRRFRDETGRSPYRYLVDVRLERAAELLRRGRCGITETALTVGFSDPSRFARMFRARFGASPAHFAGAARSRNVQVMPLD